MASPSLCAPPPMVAGGSTSLPPSLHPPIPQLHPQDQQAISRGSGDVVRQRPALPAPRHEEGREGDCARQGERKRKHHHRKQRSQDRREESSRKEKRAVGSSHIATTPSSPLEQSRDCANQILKAAMAINSDVLDKEGEVLSSVRKGEASMETRERVSRSHRLRSPMVTFSVKSPGIRILLSPRINSPLPSPSTSAMLPRRLRMRRKLTSEIWKDFEAIYDVDSVAEAQCMHCHKRIKVARDVGTSTCRRHLRTCEGKARLDQMLNQMSSSDLSLRDASLKDWKFDQEKSRQELVSLIVVHSLPFSLVEYPKFRSFVSSLNPWFTHVSRTTIKSDCIRTYEEGKALLHELLKNSTSRVSLTADLWTSKQTLGYLCVTCHYTRFWQ